VSALARMTELGIELPDMAAPAGSYVPAVRTGSLVYTSGQVARSYSGKVGAEVSAEDANAAARDCALAALAAIDALVGLDSVVRLVKVLGFVASAAGFTGQPGVINGASDVLAEIFGPAGQHARSAVGVAELPLGVPVEVELIVEVR